MVSFDMVHDDDALEERAVFIHGDGLRWSDAPWRLQKYDKDGPLTESQVSSISERFGLDRAAVRQLSSTLGFVLNPVANPHVVPASYQKGTLKAKKDMKYADRHVRGMRARLEEIIERLSLLTHVDAIADPYPPGYAQILVQLQAALEEIVRSQLALTEFGATPYTLVRWEPIDRRSLYDRRRNGVLGAIFQAWVDAGRNLSFTTDPGTSERSGELVSFAQEVCACVTDPPTEINAETIVKSILTHAKFLRPTSEMLSAFMALKK